MASTLVIAPNFLLPYSRPAQFSDYRCVVNVAGTAVIFERTTLESAGGTGNPQLQLLDLTTSGSGPQPFLSNPSFAISNRPDWSWTTGNVAFNYDDPVMVAVVGSSGVYATQFGAQTERMNYPTWFPDGAILAVEACPGNPKPNTTIINGANGNVQQRTVAGPYFWGSMPSVNPVNPNLIAFAGSHVQEGQTYDEDLNFIWVVDISNSVPPVPLEAQAPRTGYDPNFQGRAPWWSPSGKWVVFESNRLIQPTQPGDPGMYAIFLCEHGRSNPAIQVTDPMYDCNHAKWFPKGFHGHPRGAFKLIVAAYQPNPPGEPAWPYGLASLDLTPLGIPF